MRQTLYSQIDRLVTDRWAWYGVRTLLRACWIGLCICCIGLGASLVWGLPLQLEWLGVAALACVGVGLAMLLRPRMRRAEAARRLDRRFGLDEQLATAVEVAEAGAAPGTIEAQLVLNATRTSRGLRQRIRQRQRMPWVELLTVLALLLAVAGLLLLSGIGAPWLGASSSPLPPLPSASDPADLFAEEPPPPGEGGEPMPGEGGEPMPGEGGEPMPGEGQQGAAADPRTMEALADALRDQGATRPAAEALDQGDAEQAAQELRELADQAGQLSQQSRMELADNLRDAAREIERTDPEMSDQMRESARGLEASDQQASEALDDLAQAVEQMGQQGPGEQGQPGGQQGDQPGDQQSPGGSGEQGQQGGEQGDEQSGGAGNGPAGQQRPVQPERLGVDGRPVELEAEGGGQPGAEPARPGTTMPGGTGATGGGDPRSVGAVGPDPLRIPLDERDVVQEYFNP
ncbi:MAG: hypothetical protein RLZZ387_2427 [Chloroflexota bacterium]